MRLLVDLAGRAATKIYYIRTIWCALLYNAQWYNDTHGAAVSNPAAIFILFQAKQGKGRWGVKASVHEPKDQLIEAAAGLSELVGDDVELPKGPHLEHIFPTAVPNLHHERPVTLQGEDKVFQVSRRLFCGC